jgi:hypothetical protein
MRPTFAEAIHRDGVIKLAQDTVQDDAFVLDELADEINPIRKSENE